MPATKSEIIYPSETNPERSEWMRIGVAEEMFKRIVASVRGQNGSQFEIRLAKVEIRHTWIPSTAEVRDDALRVIAKTLRENQEGLTGEQITELRDLLRGL